MEKDPYSQAGEALAQISQVDFAVEDGASNEHIHVLGTLASQGKFLVYIPEYDLYQHETTLSRSWASLHYFLPCGSRYSHYFHLARM